MGQLQDRLIRLFCTPVIGGRTVLTEEEEELMDQAMHRFAVEVTSHLPAACKPEDMDSIVEQALELHGALLDEMISELKSRNVSVLSLLKPSAKGCREGVRRIAVGILGFRSVFLPAVHISGDDLWAFQIGERPCGLWPLADVLLFLMLDHAAFSKALVGRPGRDLLEYSRDVPETAWIECFRNSGLARIHLDHFDTLLESDISRLAAIREEAIAILEEEIGADSVAEAVPTRNRS